MKPHHDFTAERPLARHAQFAGKRAAPEADPTAAAQRLTERLASALPEVIGMLGGENAPEVRPLDPREGVMRELLSRGNGQCSHGLLVAEQGPSLLVSVDVAGAYQLVDMAFGGDGKLPDPLPEKLPLSAQIVTARIESEVAALVARIAGIASREQGAPPFVPLRRDSDIAALRPFAADRALWQASFEITFGGCDAWTLRLTVASEQVALLSPGDEDDTAPRARPSHAATSADPARSPFGDLPLTLCATLVDMRMPLARIAALKPGDVFPVSVARQVPLSIGERTIAHGTLGEIDDRVALQIIHAFSQEETRS
ncbi:MAG: FliM/FliN family flagellar motor switch protein [Novosphingobium sp.]|nr:FliM/FliN family flagellar motor switch protein [Novosphingobium sp.]